MNTFTAHSAHAYVVKLTPSPSGQLRGRIEHVVSGRRHDFDSSQALIDCLVHEEQQLSRDLGAGAIGASESEGAV